MDYPVVNLTELKKTSRWIARLFLPSPIVFTLTLLMYFNRADSPEAPSTFVLVAVAVYFFMTLVANLHYFRADRLIREYTVEVRKAWNRASPERRREVINRIAGVEIVTDAKIYVDIETRNYVDLRNFVKVVGLENLVNCPAREDCKDLVY